ncbi:hypothetical protein EMPS_01106 [Entomortierella parvispora]|uniref:Uncharacterized protein n=1 Tax=Entomortierella parvispora TaxID=205924 RepID=A0A9P3H289_9FUNG|nr:hypothetical protein EMPS_01106 [Entomortierella parvispora]
MFKNIFNTPESIRSAILGQDEIRARSQQGLQAVRSGVESLRTVLANNPAPNELGGGVQARDSNGTGDSGRPSEAKTTTTRGRSGSWSLLPPSLSGRSHAFNTSSSSSSSSVSTHAERNRTGYRPGGGGDGTVETASRPNSLTGSSSITESVAESIKSLSTGLSLAQFAGGLGLTGTGSLHQHHGSGSGSGLGSGTTPPSHSRRGTMDMSQTSQSSMTTVGSGSQVRKPSMPLSNRNRVWTWNGQEGGEAEEFAGGAGLGLKTGVQTEEAAKETEARLARLREQEDASLARSRRMPEVEQMAQRYQDSWKEIHEHTARNAEKADNADEILGKVLELCQRHVKASSLMETECKGLQDLGKSLDDMVVVSGNIHKKLMGLEATIEKLEENHEELTLADWKKSKVVELDKYMESKRNELWDKAELLSTRSEQFQKEEAARKLKQYQNQFESDMAHFRRTQEEKEQELLWKAAQRDPVALSEDQKRAILSDTTTPKGSENSANTHPEAKSRDEFLFGARIPSSAAVFATASKLLSSLESARRGQSANIESTVPNSGSLEASVPTPLRSPLPRTRETSTSLLAMEDVEDWKDKEDLDNFLGPSTDENDVHTDTKLTSKTLQGEDEEEDKKETIILQDIEYEDESAQEMHGDNGDEEEDADADEETSEEDSSEEDEEEEEELDPIAKARQARAAAAAAAAAGPKVSTGSTISAFSSLTKHPSKT